MERTGAEIRGLFQEICLQDLVLSLYGSYAPRLRDPEGRRLIESYLQSESDRRARIERYLAYRGAPLSPFVRSFFAAAGTLYGRLTSLFGTRFMLRTALSSSRRASRRACSLLATLAPERSPEIVYLSSLGARNEGDLVDKLRQHLIDTVARRR
jgi:hypothetical protein